MKNPKAMRWYLIICVAFVFYPRVALGQGEANHWFDRSMHIDFNYSPPKITNYNFPPNGASYFASIANEKGELLFVSDGENVYDKNLVIMPNGKTGVNYDGSFPVVAPTLIVPQPYSSKYYVFMPLYHYSAPLKYKGFSLNYCIVDMEQNNGLGDVIEFGHSLPLSENNGFIATGNCERFWLLTYNSDENTSSPHNFILKYRIDKEGLHQTPDSIIVDDTNGIWQLKFSPDSKHIIFAGYDITTPSGYKVFLYDFDAEAGTLSNKKKLNISSNEYNNFEFSPNGKLLYISGRLNFGSSDLIQYDITLDNNDSIEQSGILIHDGNPELWIGKKMLAPDGKLYCNQWLNNIGSNSAIIEYPDKRGLACSLKLDAVNFFSLQYNFVSTFLSPQFDATFDVKAGEDQETCTRTPLSLGAAPQPNTAYQWLPASHLSNTAVANPTFLHGDTLGQKTDFQYILEGRRGYCYGTDTVKVTIHPDKYAPVSGSKSVCPRVTGVDYWAAADERFRYDWSVTGGDLVSGQYSDSIKVDWGKTNPAASVTLTPYNELNCPSETITFPVRINVELQTETPLGEDLLCANLGSGIPYGITNTNGSIYTWESDAGNILSGQGTNKVTIDWPGEGKYKLWVKEQSTTIDTVCYGISDSLLVDLFRDSTTIEVDYAQVMREDPGSFQLQWYVSDTARLGGEIEIYASSELSKQWDLIHFAGKEQVDYVYPDTIMNISPVSFHIASTNGCRERIESDIHTTILLEGVADSARNAMTLSWTPYVGWSDRVDAYELWYRKDGGQYARAATFLPDERRWSNSWGANGFEHDYRIRAIHADGRTESWSNEVRLSFHHTLTIPNVFTPNDDGVNDTFTFPKLEIFHENDLLVFDRNGKEVFSRKDYDGSWDGNGIASGVYYYSFTENRYGTTYKGWVQILR